MTHYQGWSTVTTGLRNGLARGRDRHSLNEYSTEPLSPLSNDLYSGAYTLTPPYAKDRTAGPLGRVL